MIRHAGVLAVATLLGLAVLGSPAFAATARASGSPTIYASPGTYYPIVGHLQPGEELSLAECTPRSIWCRVIRRGPQGWVLGSHLVGSPAKVDATPMSPFMDFGSPLFGHRRPFP